MATSTPGGGGQTNLGVAPNVAGLLCYVPCCVGLVFAIVAAIVEKQSRFVRFHAFQSLLLHGAFFVLWVGFVILGFVVSSVAGILSVVLLPIEILVGLGLLALVIFLMIKANGGEEYELPVIGKTARQWV
ncbi:MAG: DUF4870 domain-containing protein [Burkholderiales bacterium]|jgi:uncharacterized membrane protein